MIVVKFLFLPLMFIIMYFIILIPILLLWLAVNKLILQKAITSLKTKKIVWFTSLVMLVGIEFACLFYINAHPRVEYDTMTISDETAERILTYVHEHPEKFEVEDFGGFDISKVTFKYKEEIFLVNGDPSQISYSVQAIPIGEEHYPFFRMDENNKLIYGDELILG